MESPPSYSAHSEAPPLSDDSGLIITSGSFSSDSASGWPHISLELQESDCDERSLSLCETSDTSELMCGVHFNTVKKGPTKVPLTAIDPPLQFQDSPTVNKHKSIDVTPKIEPDTTREIVLKVEAITLEVQQYRDTSKKGCVRAGNPPRILHLSPCGRPASRSSLSSRRSSSHNSLVAPLPSDDSSFITQAISHHTLTQHTQPQILDMYTVPFDSDIYAVPVDMVQPQQQYKPKKQPKNRKRGKIASNYNIAERNSKTANQRVNDCQDRTEVSSKRHSLPGSSVAQDSAEPMHMTLREVRKYLHTLYSSSSDSEVKANETALCTDLQPVNEDALLDTKESNNNHRKKKTNKMPREKHEEETRKKDTKRSKSKSSPVRMLSLNLKQTFCNLFRMRRATPGPQPAAPVCPDSDEEDIRATGAPPVISVPRRALPPLPHSPRTANAITDFATSIQKVKDYGWYWGPISVEGAEKILSSEPDGSFIVRDSSDHHYIFTLTFKLNGLRHVRIEHEQGNFCFGGCTMFKAQTIVEFIEKAVETSRSGRYLFFLNLRPVLGPVRVQLLHPVSRFKRVQSLQHMCRFVILKVVRRDHVKELPLPRRLIDYLGATHYFSEMLPDL